MSYYLKESPLLQQLIHQIAECNEDDLSYELWRDGCIQSGWVEINIQQDDWVESCLLYTSPSPRDGLLSRMPSSA